MDNRRANDPVPLRVTDDDSAITREELQTLKRLAANYKAAQYGMAALIATGGFVVVLLEIWTQAKNLIGK